MDLLVSTGKKIQSIREKRGDNTRIVGRKDQGFVTH